MDYQVQLQMLADIILAALLGGIIGFERELHRKSAGLRTHMLVAAASAFLVGLGNIVVASFAGVSAEIRTDPIRIIEAVITGVSFLGAGSIIRTRGQNHVEGLTTAAAMLFVAAVGVSVALSQYVLAVGATVFVLAVLRGMKFIDAWTVRRRRRQVEERPPSD
ncbi:MAG: MgtC/SapB family protein [Chloroflexota bacterium]|jgi:putative Mg2+ transporter-C (MgtC) family protein|nr:MgtC/SapB family protein [Chloroflexota bacterium]